MSEIIKHTQTLTLEKESLRDLFGDLVSHNYLAKLSTTDLVPIGDENETNMRWFRITKIVKEDGVFFTDIFSSLYTSLHNDAKTVSLVIHKENNENGIEIYLGAKDIEGNNYVSGNILRDGLQSFSPGVVTNMAKDMNHICYDEPYISSVSALASLKDEKKEKFIQGIERLINATSTVPKFTAYFIADNVSDGQAQSIIRAYNNMRTSLHPMCDKTLSYSEQHTQGVSDSLTESLSESISENISHTVTHTEGTNKSYSKGGSEGKSTSTTKTSSHSGSASILLASYSYSRSNSKTTTESETETWTNTSGSSVSDGTSEQSGKGMSNTKGTQTQKGTNSADTKGETLQITNKDYEVEHYMKVLEKQTERLTEGMPSGLWNFSTFFVSPSVTTSKKLANLYRGCVIGEKSSGETCAINSWDKDMSKRMMDEYLSKSKSPRFIYNGINVPAGNVVTSKELAINMSLPQSSVPGVIVIEEPAFGRNVTCQKDLNDSNSVKIGVVQHLGKESEDVQVRLDIDELSRHTLVAGTTGSGKSNTICLLLSEMAKNGVKFLIIEPAKGEYMDSLGNISGVKVYGTNPKKSDLLCLNPFEFPEDIDVYEHIDHLVEIFNACWPMYAAMPQVLKHSIIEAYRSCGWDLDVSENKYGIFPTIEDVLDCLKEYINESEYSAETKGDYKGSLETRLMSLTEGIVGRMFTNKPIADDTLFNSNVIVDLSRVQSSETKSLLMGILVMKLKEFRMTENKGANRKLHHITVLEEAHNLLKRTSTAQDAESSNVAGMAVEAISNSMAEMRTYGEGFIIADQSPSMLDLAVIRNTNTKIIMSLPEKDDRELVGKSASLNDKQIEAISKLKCGEAIVYQNSWQEAVRSKIEYYETKSVLKNNHKSFCSNNNLADMLRVLINLYSGKISDYKVEDFVSMTLDSKLSGIRKLKIAMLLEGKAKMTKEDAPKVAFLVVPNAANFKNCNSKEEWISLSYLKGMFGEVSENDLHIVHDLCGTGAIEWNETVKLL